MSVAGTSCVLVSAIVVLLTQSVNGLLEKFTCTNRGEISDYKVCMGFK